MNFKLIIRIAGLLILAGVIDSHATLNNGYNLIIQGHIATIFIGTVEVMRWLLALLAALALLRLQSVAKWLMLAAFVCGLFVSWVSFIPFGGILMNFINPASLLQNFIVIQLPNVILVVIVFYCLAQQKKSSKESATVSDA